MPKKEAPPLPELLTTDEAAALLRRGKRTLQDWRYDGVGPHYWRVGRRVYYTRDGIAQWLRDQQE